MAQIDPRCDRDFTNLAQNSPADFWSMVLPWTMDLQDDLIYKIICFLPLKLAIQCKCLNKNFNQLISHPKFAQHHALLSNQKSLLYGSGQVSKIYHKISLNPPYSVNSRVESRGVRVLMSSKYSGRLLLRFFGTNSVWVYNPVSGAYFIVPWVSYWGWGPDVIGMVDEFHSPHYKLVAMVDHRFSTVRLQFKIFESQNFFWRVKNYEKRDIIGWNDGPFARSSQPVYVHGCLHWLIEDGDVLVFDVKNELPRVINKPDDIRQDGKHNNIWLGEAGGSLVLAIAYEGEVVIYVYDYVNRKWCCKSIISTILYAHGNGKIIYYDEEILILVAGDGDIFVCKIKVDAWQKIRNPGIAINEILSIHPYVPALASIPFCYYLKVNENMVEKYDRMELEPKGIGEDDIIFLNNKLQVLSNLRSLLLLS